MTCYTSRKIPANIRPLYMNWASSTQPARSRRRPQCNAKPSSFQETDSQNEAPSKAMCNIQQRHPGTTTAVSLVLLRHSQTRSQARDTRVSYVRLTLWLYCWRIQGLVVNAAVIDWPAGQPKMEGNQPCSWRHGMGSLFDNQLPAERHWSHV